MPRDRRRFSQYSNVMVQVLTVNCLPPIVAAINSDPRCGVVAASYERGLESRASADLGDPRQYRVVVLDMETTGSGFEVSFSPLTSIAGSYGLSPDEIAAIASYPTVSSDYLQELRALGAIFIDMVHGPSIPEVSGYRYPHFSDSYQTPDLSTTADPAGILFEPFIADYGTDIGRRSISISDMEYSSLVEDQHGNSVAGIAGNTITVAGINDLERRSLAIRDLVTRIAFGAFPEVLAGDVQSDRVSAITAGLAESRARYLTERGDLESELAEEQAFLARFGPLVLSMDEALKSVVMKALREIGLAALDLDEATTGPKTLDIHVSGQSINIETRGRTTRNANVRDVGVIVGHADELEGGEYSGANTVFVLNGQLGVPVGDREPSFNPTVVQEAESQGVTLMTGSDFLDAVSNIRSGEYSTPLFLADLRRPGRFSRSTQIELADG